MSPIVELLGRLGVSPRLVGQLAVREVRKRTQGTSLGIAWLILAPLCMLAVYTSVFSLIFQSRWPGGTGSRTEFAILVFAGLTVFGFFGDVLGRSPTLISDQPNFVKKVVFPLESLCWVSVLAALFGMLLNLVVLLAAVLLFRGHLPLQALFLPIYLIPLVILTVGLCLLICALGVYFRDLSQIVSLAISALLFLTPVFYPVNAVPEGFSWAIRLNPLTFYVEAIRSSLIWGGAFDLSGFLMAAAIAVLVFAGALWVFRHLKAGFADVV